MLIITGANGFVGQHLAPMALKYFKPSQILCLVSQTMRSPLLEERGNKILKQEKLKTLEVDLVTEKGLYKLPRSPEVVIHMAANTNTSIPDHRSNDLGTKNLIKALEPLGPNTHIIYTSTTVIMSGRDDCSKPFNESDKPKPTNEYGRSKLRAEEFLRQQCQKYKFRLTIVRINTIYGDDPREYKLFKVLKKQILNGFLVARLNWPGLTGLIHVDDVASALLMLARKKTKPGKPETYILYSENLSLSEISRIMHEKMGLKYRPINLPKSFWKLCSYMRRFIPLIEKISSPAIYNLFWRWSLIVDNVIWCKSDKAFKALPRWKPLKFIDAVEDVID